MSEPTEAPPSKLWPRVLLALWCVWLLALIVMGWSEWNSPRPLPKNSNEAKFKVH